MVFGFLSSLFDFSGPSALAQPVSDKPDSVGYSNGLGKFVEWKSFSDAVKMKSGHPIMVVVHDSKCGACENFRSWFSKSQEIRTLSENFEMVNLIDDEAEQLKSLPIYCPYVPRVIFFSPTGYLLKQYGNENLKNNYCYFYSEPKSLVKTMTDVLLAFPPKPQYDKNICNSTHDFNQNFSRNMMSFLPFAQLFGWGKNEEDDFLNNFKWEKFDYWSNWSSKRPIMAVILKSTCPACKRFRTWFSSSEEIQIYSRQFKMVYFEDGDAFDFVEIFDQNHRYVPRVYFLTPSGKLMDQYRNKNTSPEYCFNYGDPNTLAEIMKKVIRDTR